MKRYCKTCFKETLHDQTDYDNRTANIKGVTRIFLAVASGLVSEMIREPAWKCQVCDKVTKK